MIRQGDILLVPMQTAPEGYVETGKNPVLGLGEVTGHKHVLMDAVWMVAPEEIPETLRQFAVNGGSKFPVFVVAGEAATLTHEEHAPIRVEPGVWQVVRQREYTPQAVRPVYD